MSIKVDGDLQKETYTKNEVKKIIDFCVLATIQDINPRLEGKLSEIKLAYDKKRKIPDWEFCFGSDTWFGLVSFCVFKLGDNDEEKRN